MKSFLSSLTLFVLMLAATVGGVDAAAQDQVAEYVRDNVLGGVFSGENLWMTDTALDPNHVARDVDATLPDVPFPYPLTWLVMIDDDPETEWCHPCRWLFVNDNLLEHTTPEVRDCPPSVFTSVGDQVGFGCSGTTPVNCPPPPPGSSESGDTPGPDNDCLYAVLVSGGGNARNNRARYPNNLGKMYKTLRACGFPKGSIYTYYSDGGSLDLDNTDGDGQHSTGGDVNGAASEDNIGGKIRELCARLRRDRDILYIYITNHGMNDHGAVLWDFDGDGRWSNDDNEIYTPDELAADTENCACRLFIVLDTCFSGEFLSIATDGNHENTAVYTSTTADDYSYSSAENSQYITAWSTNDPASTSMNGMHPGSLPSSSPQSAEGGDGVGSESLCDCCETTSTDPSSWGTIKSIYR